jgi:type IV secretion system protein VirB4
VQQWLKRSIKFGSRASLEIPVARHLPFLRHADARTIVTKDGHFVSVVKMGGFCFQTADQAEIDMRLTARNTVIRAMNDSRFAVYSHIVRREVSPTIGGRVDNWFAGELDRRFMASLADKRMFVNDLYFTVIRRGFQGRVGLAESIGKYFRKSLGADEAEFRREAMQELRDVVSNLEKEFRRYQPRVLKAVRRGDAVFSEPCEFFIQLVNGGIPQLVALPRMGLDQYLAPKRVTFGKKAFEIRGASENETRFGAMLSIKEYPPYSGAGMIDGLLRIPAELIVTQSFSLADRAPVLSLVKKVERQIGASDEAGTEVEEAIATARNELLTNRTVLGEHHLTVQCLGRSLRELDRCLQAANEELQSMGTIVVREDMNAEPCFWAQLPGNFGYIARKALISSRNFCGFASLHNFAVGKADGNRWGPAISILETTSQTPYYFNFHRRQVGSFTVVGPTGSGKTVALGFLLCEAMRISPRPRVAFFDKDRGADPLIRALGGRYEAIIPGRPTGFNPLHVPDTPVDRAFLNALLQFLVRPRDGGDLSAEQQKIVESAVEQVFEIPVRERRFDEVPDLLRGRERASHDDLASRFQVWLKSRGWLFNNPTDVWDASNGIFGFDMTLVLEDADIRTAALAYIFHRIESMMDGTPLIMVIDEGWKILDDPKFATFLNDKLKTIRKLNGIIGFGTQSARDIVSAEKGHTLLEQTPTNLFFPNPRADEESHRVRFGLSHQEFKWVKDTSPESRQFLIKHDHDSVIAKLDLSSMQDFVKVLSGNVETVAECEELRERVGDAPEKWLPVFCGWEKESRHAR